MLRPVHCNVQYGPTPQPFHTYDTFENQNFDFRTTVKVSYGVSSVCVEGQSLLF